MMTTISRPVFTACSSREPGCATAAMPMLAFYVGDFRKREGLTTGTTGQNC
jgi:hypothetical protein